MMDVQLGVLAGAVALGAVHGIEPGHGWPVAASYALDRSNRWVAGFAAGLIIGVGHLVSSIAMVAAFFYAKAYFDLASVNEPITVFGSVQVGGPVSLVAGVLLIALGVREYRHGHAHGEGVDGEHDREEHGHDAHDGSEKRDGVFARVKGAVALGGQSHAHEEPSAGADRGLFGIAWVAFVLGFAHEEEFEIIALCAGSDACLFLMGAYALTVIVGILGLTLLLIGGYQHSRETVEQYTPYLPLVSASVLCVMGLGFILGVL
jgi:hypothetical protein